MANQGWADITTMRNKSQLEADGNEICVAFLNWIQAMISTFYWECTVACLILEPAQVVNILLRIADYRGMWVCFKFVSDAGCSAFSIMEKALSIIVKLQAEMSNLYIFYRNNKKYVFSKYLSLQEKKHNFFIKAYLQLIHMCHGIVM